MKRLYSLLPPVLVLLNLFLPSQSFAQDKPRIAVVEFIVKVPAGRELGTAMSDLLTNALVQTEQYAVLERQAIERIRSEQKLTSTGEVDAATGAQIGKLLGAQFLVVGSVTKFEEKDKKGIGGILGKNVIGGVGVSTAEIGVTIRIIESETGVISASQTINQKERDSVDVRLRPTPDLVVANAIAPNSANLGEDITVQWSVKNQGAGEPFETGWQDRIYLSRTATFELNSATVLGVFNRSGALTPDSTYARNQTARIPSGFAGENYIFVHTDWNNGVFEYQDDGNNLSPAGQPIAITNPDFVVSSVGIPNSANSGKSIEINWTVANNGPGAALNQIWNDRVYISQQPAFDPNSAMLIGSFSRSGALPKDSSYVAAANYTLPNGIAGDYYVFVETNSDGRVFENQSSENNRGRSPAAMRVELSPWADLRVAEIIVPDSLDAGIPNSHVTALPTALNNTTFTLSWSGADDSTGSSISDYALHVSTDGQPFQLFEDGLIDTSLVFSGDFGSSYRFFTIARDHAGNAEALKTTADATITLDPTVSVPGEEVPLPKSFTLYLNYPNPFNPTTTTSTICRWHRKSSWRFPTFLGAECAHWLMPNRMPVFIMRSGMEKITLACKWRRAFTFIAFKRRGL